MWHGRGVGELGKERKGQQPKQMTGRRFAFLSREEVYGRRTSSIWLWQITKMYMSGQPRCLVRDIYYIWTSLSSSILYHKEILGKTGIAGVEGGD